MLVASVLSHLVIRTWRFWKIKEKKYKRNINNDLAVVASHMPVEVVHDKILPQCLLPLLSNTTSLYPIYPKLRLRNRLTEIMLIVYITFP